MTQTLENRRARVLALISIAQADRNAVKQAQGYYLLREINSRLADQYAPKF